MAQLQQISSKQSTRVVPGYRSSQVATVLHQAEIRCILFISVTGFLTGATGYTLNRMAISSKPIKEI